MPLLKKLQRLLLPYTCILCNTSSDQDRDLCQTCEKELPWLDWACQRCGVRLPESAHHPICGECLHIAPAFDHMFALWEYQDPINTMIGAIKFHNQLLYARLLGELLAEHAQQRWYKQRLPDLIIPVPLHTQRLRQRGYNQSLEIAKTVGKRLRLPLDRRSCMRVKATLPQSELAHTERAENMKNAFVLRHAITAKHVVVIDDVVTTRHTVTELSRVLKDNGVERVDIWCCARTQPK